MKTQVKNDICTKIYPKHQLLSPGLLALVCIHRICYGFEILESKESTTNVLRLLLTRFKDPPRNIIYDNARNLHNTCVELFIFINWNLGTQNYSCTLLS